ncbi:hypothetical protein DNTS_030183 [Danionella cerebrum]|uniref:GPS domain-containing protein n=1 Tax=Danionella cerebrum TaxID=2873325 RepID=A0A553Q832_9TELE|nr:hypothetical protein DNTS_030183 [Danionella translucida]
MMIVAIERSPKIWYCSPLANTSYCANASSYVDCRVQSSPCMAYSCERTSPGCSCKLGSYFSNKSYINYEPSPDLCTCSTDSCFCLHDIVQPNTPPELAIEHIVNFVGQIANMASTMSPELKLAELVTTENKTTLVSHATMYLNAFESLASALVKETENYSTVNIILKSADVSVVAIGREASKKDIVQIQMKDAGMDIDLYQIAQQSTSRSAAVAFLSYSSMDNLLKPEFFNTSNETIKTMMSSVISATLPKTSYTQLTKPVNFTLRHIRELDSSGSLSCVYWNVSEWIVDGCSVLESTAESTVCSCVHLSTFALIMQTSPSAEDDPLKELVNLVCVIVGLVSFALALLTFALCQWGPGVNNVARINICISLLLAHLLFLLTQRFLSLIQPQQVLCTSISGLLHFLFLSGFVWMFIEAILLYICVKNLSKISSKKREVLSSGFLCVIGYTVALVVVSVSIGLVPEGYGSKHCWIKTEEGFIWSFLGPVCVILGLNTILFIAIVVILNSTLKNLNAEVSQMKQTKTMVFKTLAQMVVLGCPWALGFFTNVNTMLEIIFLVLNSQQGTFIFLIYCVLNKEIRQQYWRYWRSVLKKH